jgi:hypothetical protein
MSILLEIYVLRIITTIYYYVSLFDHMKKDINDPEPMIDVH